MSEIKWVRCPVCGSKTRLQIRKDTELKNFPLYCPKCKQETLNETPRSKLRGISPRLTSFVISLLRSKLRGIKPSLGLKQRIYK